MTLNQHLVATGLAAAALAPVLTAGEMGMFCIGSVLIDADHYLCYIQRRRNLSVRGMFRYFEELWKIEHQIPYYGLCIFHTIDFFILVWIGAWFYPVLRPLLAGLLFHFAVDLYDLFRKQMPFIRAYFLVEHLIRRRQPGYPYF